MSDLRCRVVFQGERLALCLVLPLQEWLALYLAGSIPKDRASMNCLRR